MTNIYGDYATLGDRATLGHGATLGLYATLGHGATLGLYATIGDNATLGRGATIGLYATIGDNATLGLYATIGDNATIGDRFTCEGVKVIRFMTMANVDGSGRRIYVYVHTEGILIRAGCFLGDLDAFCEKAKGEGKDIYAAVVGAAAQALQAQVQALGLTGGWDV